MKKTCKKKVLFKTLGCMDREEYQNTLKWFKEDNNLPLETDDDEILEDVRDDLNFSYECDFGRKDSNLSYSSLKNAPVVVTGVLGLWDGQHTIQPKKFENLNDALAACGTECDEFEIWEDRYGNFYFEGYHHDGHNHFCIKKATDNGLRCLHFCKEVFGV